MLVTNSVIFFEHLLGVNYIRIKNYVSVRTPTTPHYGFMHNEPDRRGIEYECKGFAEYGDWAIPELIATKYCSSVSFWCEHFTHWTKKDCFQVSACFYPPE